MKLIRAGTAPIFEQPNQTWDKHCAHCDDVHCGDSGHDHDHDDEEDDNRDGSIGKQDVHILNWSITVPKVMKEENSESTYWDLVPTCVMSLCLLLMCYSKRVIEVQHIA